MNKMKYDHTHRFLRKTTMAGVKNKEVRTILYDQFNLVPRNEVEFLRYLIYKITGKTLLIKDKKTIDSVKESSIDCYKYFGIYKSKYGLQNLAKIFYRFKPLFLAFKGKSSLNKIINKIRKLAKKHHKPLKQDYMNNVTSDIKNGQLEDSKLINELKDSNQFRKIRLANALKYRTIKDADSIMYRIRNGKAWAADYSYKDTSQMAEHALGYVYESIVNGEFKDKKVYLPDNIKYALPSTEKQFVENVPSGTCFSAEKDMLVGVHWKDVNGRNIDLDLSLLSLNGKFGWDGAYRNSERTVMFSGDITSAPNGATEVFYIGKQEPGNYLINLNYYNYSESVEVPFTIFVASEKAIKFGKNYTVDPNNVIGNIHTKINEKQQIIGLLNVTEEGTNFYVTNMNIGKSITATNNEYMDKSRRFLVNSFRNIITLNDVLDYNKIEIVDNKEDADIDLSYENLERDTIINLLK